MRQRRFLLITLIWTLSIGSIAAALRAAPCDHNTLLQWSYGATSDGGAPLDEPLISDRPDFTESPVTVGYGVVQLETGYTYTFDDEHGVRISNHSFPESLLRLGLFADWFELRLEWNYEIQRTNSGGVVRKDFGSDDLSLGMKLALTPQDCILPETGLIIETSVPSGANPFSADEVLPGINFCYDWDLTGSDTWSLGGSTALNGDVDDITTDNCVQFSQSLSLDHAWTKMIHSYVEWYVLSPVSADTNRPQYYFNRGFTVAFTNNIQWDVRAGLGLNRAADDFFAGTGLTVRYW